MILLSALKNASIPINQYVYVHHAGDVVDHRRLHEAVVTACRPTPGHVVKRILVGGSEQYGMAAADFCPFFQPNWFVDISDQWEVNGQHWRPTQVKCDASCTLP